MPIRQRLSTTDDGRAVVIKQATGDGDVARLAREAALLRAAAHPGVVELLAERTVAGGGREVMLALAGTRTAADLRVPLLSVAGLIAALATTVADLHALGIAHGRIRADHVVIDAGGRPVLCGFGEAVRFEPGDGAAAVLPTAVDVAWVGALLRRLLTADSESDVAWSPIPERRFSLRDRWAAHTQRALLNVADHATADDPATRPSARALATAVLAALPEARLPDAASGTDEAALPPPSVPWPRRSLDVLRRCRSRGPVGGRRASAIIVAVGLAAAVFAGAALLRPDTTTASPPPASPPTRSELPSRAGSTPATGTAAAARSPRCPEPMPGGAVLADHDGDGCPSSIVLSPGTVAVDGVRFSVGGPADLLAIGDWNCDGRATVALVEHDSGRVYLFADWAGAGHDISVPPVTTVPRAVAVASHDLDGDGCPSLVVTDAAGERTAVEP